MGLTSAAFWIEHLQLIPHPEGGYYRQTYASEATFDGRPASTAIYFLLESGNFSAFHRIRSDELWHFYTGDPLEVFVLQHNGCLEKILLGPDAEHGEGFQAVVPAGLWFASRVVDPGSFSVVGCTVSPGFVFADFELAARNELIAAYPQHATLIAQLTRD